MGILKKDDRRYGILLNLADAAISLNEAKQEVVPGKNVTNWKLKMIKLRFEEIEWIDRNVKDNLNVMSDLTIVPFYTLPWHHIAEAYRKAARAQTLALENLIEHNYLAEAFRTEKPLRKSELPLWRRKLSTLQIKIGSVGILAQSCKKMEARSSVLTKRAVLADKTGEQKANVAAQLEALMESKKALSTDFNKGSLNGGTLRDEFKRKQSSILQEATPTRKSAFLSKLNHIILKKSSKKIVAQS